jgi:hypothetical protein
MSKVDDVSNKISQMKLEDLLRMTAAAIDSCMDEKRLDFILIHLEMALQKRRMMMKLGIKNDQA